MLLPLLPIDEVQIVPFPAFNNLQPLMPEEIPFGDLLGFVNEPQHDQEMHDQLHVGFVQMPDLFMDPLFYERF